MHCCFTLNDSDKMPRILSDQTTEQKAHSSIIRCKTFGWMKGYYWGWKWSLEIQSSRCAMLHIITKSIRESITQRQPHAYTIKAVCSCCLSFVKLFGKNDNNKNILSNFESGFQRLQNHFLMQGELSYGKWLPSVLPWMLGMLYRKIRKLFFLLLSFHKNFYMRSILLLERAVLSSVVCQALRYPGDKQYQPFTESHGSLPDSWKLLIMSSEFRNIL